MSLLELRRIRMEYGAIRALAEVDFAVAPGEIVGLIGDNGAGKSTLVKIIAGNFPPTHGTMHFDGHEVRFRGPQDARNAGIEVVYQDLALCDNLSGAANVFLGRELRRQVADRPTIGSGGARAAGTPPPAHTRPCRRTSARRPTLLRSSEPSAARRGRGSDPRGRRADRCRRAPPASSPDARAHKL